MGINNYKPWLESELDIIKKMFDKNKNNRDIDVEISKVLKRSKSSIANARYKLGLKIINYRPVPKPPPEFIHTRAYRYYLEMQKLLKFCESSTCQPKIDKAKERLLHLSNLYSCYKEK